MERLIKPITFSNGVILELKKSDDLKNLVMSLSGGPLERALQALGTASLDLESTAADQAKLGSALSAAKQVFSL